MTTNMNRNFCFNCGEQVDPAEHETVGNTRLWVCGQRECQRELQKAYREYCDERREELEDELRGGW